MDEETKEEEKEVEPAAPVEDTDDRETA